MSTAPRNRKLYITSTTTGMLANLMNQLPVQRHKRKKLFGASQRHETESRMTALTNPLIAEKLAQLSRYKREIQSWEALRTRILSDLAKRQQALKQDLIQLQEFEDPAKKRYLMKSLLQQWRDNDLTLESQRQELHSRIVELAAQFTHELSLIASHTPGLEDGAKVELVHDTVLETIEALIGICQRLEDTMVKPDLARHIGDLIDTAAALDARAVHAHAQIVRFRNESPYLRDDGGILRHIAGPRSLRQRSSARHLQSQLQSLDE